MNFSMKTINVVGKSIFLLAVVALLLMNVSGADAQRDSQKHSESGRKTASFNRADGRGQTLILRNINGNLTVEGYSGNTVQIEYTRNINAKHAVDLEKGKREIDLGVAEYGDRVLVYLDSPYTKIDRNKANVNYSFISDKIKYEFSIDITIKVPQHANLDLNVINSDEMLILNTQGEDAQFNLINGRMDLENVKGQITAKTINGKITGTFHEAPIRETNFNTINGEIDVTYPRNLDAEVRYKSIDGDLYTDYEDVKRISASSRGDSEPGKGNEHRVHNARNAPFQVGKGGVLIQFDVIHGDVYLRKMN